MSAVLISVIKRPSVVRCEPAPAVERRARIWFQELERMRAALGVRAQTQHIDARRWARYFEAGNLPGDALLSALIQSAD